MKEFDIFNSKPRKVKCVRNDECGMMVNSQNHYLLEIGKIYTVADVEVFSWFTSVYLEEFPGTPFNSVMFEEIDD